MNKNKLSTIIAMSSVLILASVSTAQADPKGFYAGAAFGSYDINNDSIDNNDRVLKTLVGYKFTSLMGIEGSWTDFNKVNNGNDRFEADGFGIAAVVTFRNGIFLKGGQFFWSSDAVYSNAQQASNGNDPLWGAGYKYGFNEHFALRLEAERYDIKDTHLYTYTAGVDYKF